MAHRPGIDCKAGLALEPEFHAGSQFLADVANTDSEKPSGTAVRASGISAYLMFSC